MVHYVASVTLGRLSAHRGRPRLCSLRKGAAQCSPRRADTCLRRRRARPADARGSRRRISPTPRASVDDNGSRRLPPWRTRAPAPRWSRPSRCHARCTSPSRTSPRRHLGRGEFSWQPSHSGDGAERLPECRTHDGGGLPGLRHQLEPAGGHRSDRVDARQRRRHRRARHPGPPDLRPCAGRHAGRQRGHRAERAGRPGHLRPRHGPDAVPARHLGPLRLRRGRRRQGRRAEPVRLDASPPPAISAAAASTCATSRRS